MATKSVFRMRAMTNSHPVIDPLSLPDELNRMPDAMFQSPHFFDAVSILGAHFSDDPTVFVDGNTIVCYNPDNLNDRVFPDCYVAFDVDAEAIFRQNGYLTWQVGKAPDFVLEIASETTARRDITYKRDLYERIGVKEYWRFDAKRGEYYGRTLAGDRLVDGAYEDIEIGINADGLPCGYSPLLRLSLCVTELGRENLKRMLFYEPVTGEYLPNLKETQADLSEAQARIRDLEEKLRRHRRQQ